jgi:molecular chaperone HscC
MSIVWLSQKKSLQCQLGVLRQETTMICSIDLGTTNSLIAIWKDGASHIIPNALGNNLTPSVVGLDDNQSILVGQAAKERLSTHPQFTAANFKRYMGTNWEIKLGKRSFRAEELSSLVLRSLVSDAEAFLGEKITEVIITVPAYFSDAQRKATKAAGELTGLKVERLLNEPTAAAMAYGLHTKASECQYLVFDLGGGTFDVSILEMFEGVMEVHASAGDNQLGGTDFTETLAQYFIKKSDIASLGVKTDALPEELLQRILIQAEKVKREICASGKSVFAVNWNDRTVSLAVEETGFETIVEPLLERITTPIKAALRDAKVRIGDIDEIVLVGGATRMPCVRKLATRLFQRFPATDINPDEVVAHGVAIQAGLKLRNAELKDLVLTDVCPYTLGVEVVKGEENIPGHFQPIIERNCFIPISRVEGLCSVQDNQKLIEVKIFQGESPLVKDNIFLGKLKAKVPKADAGEEIVDVRFTYDINGILEVIVTINSTKESHTLVIEENPGVLSQAEIAKRLKKLESLKIHPRELLENTVVTNRADRLYRELLGKKREAVGYCLAEFISVLERQDRREIAAARTEFVEALNQIEGEYQF